MPYYLCNLTKRFEISQIISNPTALIPNFTRFVEDFNIDSIYLLLTLYNLLFFNFVHHYVK